MATKKRFAQGGGVPVNIRVAGDGANPMAARQAEIKASMAQNATPQRMGTYEVPTRPAPPLLPKWDGRSRDQRMADAFAAQRELTYQKAKTGMSNDDYRAASQNIRDTVAMPQRVYPNGMTKEQWQQDYWAHTGADDNLKKMAKGGSVKAKKESAKGWGIARGARKAKIV